LKTFLHKLPLEYFYKSFCTNVYVNMIIYDIISTRSVVTLIYFFIHIWLNSSKSRSAYFNNRNFYTNGAIRLTKMLLYVTHLMVNSFGIIFILLSINVNAFCGVEPFNLLDYMNIVVEYVTWFECNLKRILIYVPWHWGIITALLIHQNFMQIDICWKKLILLFLVNRNIFANE
jgi:hypothetical protein